MGKNGSFNLGFTVSSEDLKGNDKAPNDVIANNNHDKSSSSINIVKTLDEEDDHGPERANWGHGLEFLMSCISLSVGLGNIWRFPFTAYENGGGAFLIPYIIVLILIGKPIYYFEMVLGQFCSKGSVRASSVVPVLKGVAIGQMVATASVNTYYVSLICLTLFYLIRSFYNPLPWADCWDKWNDVNCVPARPSNITFNTTGGVSSSELYFIREVTKQKDNINDGIGWPDWQLTLYLFLAWAIVYLVIIKGVKSSGKVSYFTAIFPYAVLITLLIRALTLDGVLDGIKFFITPDWKKLLQPQVWYYATTQLFFSLSVGQGTIIMFSSYNRFDHNIYRDALIVTTMDTFTSLLGGFTIFGILGNLAYNLGEDVENVIKSGGSGLAFISYPEAIAKFKIAPQLFAVLFFFMLFTLGVGSAVGLQSAIVSNLMDVFPNMKQWKMAGITSSIGFLIGLLYVTPGGQWVLNLVDHFGGTFLVFALSILQICGIFWIYGLENFCWDLEFMLKRKVTLFWRISWMFVTPLLLIVIFIYTMARLENPTYASKSYPTSALIVGWFIFSFGVAQTVIWALWLVMRDPHKSEAIRSLFRQNPEWGPKSPKIFKEWKSYKEERLATRRSQSDNHSNVKKFTSIVLGKYD